MTEIEGKKYYTWDEIRAMPLGTRFRLRINPSGSYFYLKRQEEGHITLHTDRDNAICGDVDIQLILQDRFELVEETQEREYVTGCQALEKLISGEWEKIACDDTSWSHCHNYIQLNLETQNIACCRGMEVSVQEISAIWLRLKKWYEYKEQQ